MSPAAAGLTADIKNCRAAIDKAELFGDGDYMLDLVSDRGKRSRVVTLDVRVIGGDDQRVECRMNRSRVEGVAIIAAD